MSENSVSDESPPKEMSFFKSLEKAVPLRRILSPSFNIHRNDYTISNPNTVMSNFQVSFTDLKFAEMYSPTNLNVNLNKYKLGPKSHFISQ